VYRVSSGSAAEQGADDPLPSAGIGGQRSRIRPRGAPGTPPMSRAFAVARVRLAATLAVLRPPTGGHGGRVGRTSAAARSTSKRGFPMTTGDIDAALATTRSVRKRLDLTRPVPRDLIQERLALAQQASTAGNRQLSSFVVVTDPDIRAALGQIYRRGWERYVAEGLVEPPGPPARDPAARARQRRIGAVSGGQSGAGSGACHPGDQAPHREHGQRRDGVALRVGPAGGPELHAGRTRSRARQGLDDDPPVLRARGRAGAWHPPTRRSPRPR